MHRGFIKIYRKIEESGLLQVPNTLALFMYLLLKATHKDITAGSKSGFIELKRGQFISGRKQLATALNQSEQEIRTGLERLKKMKIITIKTTNKYSIYTIENYSLYQDIDSQSTSNPTNNQPAVNQQSTTKQELKNLRTKENIYTPEFSIFWEAWPANNRKGSKSKVNEVWIRKKLDVKVDVIIKHINEVIRVAESKFVPAPLTYLNQERWDGWEPSTSSINDLMEVYI